MSKYIKKNENGFYVFDEMEFLKTLPTGLEYFAVDKETEQIYNLGFNYKEKMDKQISDLEAKLAESEEQLKEELVEKKCLERALSACNRQNDEFSDMIKKLVNEKEELKQQLEKSEKSKESYRLQNEQHHLQLLQFYSRLGVEAFGVDIHEKSLETLMIMKEQLAEKDKELSEYVKIVDDLHKQLSDKCDFCDKTKDQDKISFAIAELEKVKDIILNERKITSFNFDIFNKGKDTALFWLNEQIDNQINELKEKVEDVKD